MVQQVITDRGDGCCHTAGAEEWRGCVFGGALSCAAQKEGERLRSGWVPELLHLRGAWVIGWVGEPVVEGEDESVDDTCSFLGFALEPGVFSKDLWVCILLGW